MATRVLLIQPNWSAPSELWSQRMIEALEPHLAAIGAYGPTETAWRGRVPAVDLRDRAPARWRRIARRLHIPAVQAPARTSAQILARLVADETVTVVLAHYLDFALRFADVWKRSRKPLFVHCHGYDTEWDFRRWDAPEQRLFPEDYTAQVRRLSERAMLIANSHCTAGRLAAAGVSADRVVVKYLGVPVPETPPTPAPPTTPVELLFLGRLVDCKGPDLTIRAFELACERGLNGRLTIAGDGPLRMTCELLRRRSPYAERIRMTGAVDAAAGVRLRATAHIFTAHNCRGPLTGQEEAFGVSFIEAMAAGLPVVTGRQGGVCESVVAGETGVLFDPGDIDAHAEALLRLAADPDRRRQLGLAGWRRARAHFTSEQERVELLHILGLVNGAPRRAAPAAAACHAEASLTTSAAEAR